MSYLIKTTPTYIAADPTQQKQISVTSGGTVYYSTTSDTNAEDTAIEKGNSAIISAGQYFISASTSKVRVEDLTTLRVEDITISDDLSISDDLAVTGTSVFTGATTHTGGVVSSGTLPGVWAGNVAALAKTSGTDVAFAEKQLFVSSVWLPANKTLTGVGVLLGTEGGTNKLVAGLFNAAGEVLAKSSEATEGTVAGTKETIQEIPFTATYAATGPRLYYIGVTGNGNTAKLRTIPIAGKNVFAKKVELASKNVLASITAPTTFTADEGPVGFVY